MGILIRLILLLTIMFSNIARAEDIEYEKKMTYGVPLIRKEEGRPQPERSNPSINDMSQKQNGDEKDLINDIICPARPINLWNDFSKKIICNKERIRSNKNIDYENNNKYYKE